MAFGFFNSWICEDIMVGPAEKETSNEVGCGFLVRLAGLDLR